MRTNTLSSIRCFGLALTAAVCLTACPPAAEQKTDKPPTTGGDGPVAVTTLEARSNSTVKGQATFTQAGDKVKILVEVSGATPGQHGLHVHENGDCSAPDAKSAGGHFNPGNAEHGAPDKATHHAGDFGNLTVGEDGNGKLELLTDQISVNPGTVSVVGRALVLHEKVDDTATQPTGNSGGRIGCGVINLKQ
ncbi:MAG TPA: superoxide dismutase family protein [Pseudomonadota bacterium]|nr:superoxide dismutase family protein [Pseudomonadota bacterium]